MKKRKIEGIYGWLAFYRFILVLGLLLSIRAFLIGRFYENLITFILSAIILFVFGYSLILLSQKKKAAIYWNIFVWWFNASFVVIVKIFILENFYFPDLAIVLAIIWTLYFVRSKRVKNTLIR